MVGTCFACDQRTTISLYAVLRGRRWLEDELKWLVDDMGRSVKTLTNGVSLLVAVKLSNWGPQNPLWISEGIG